MILPAHPLPFCLNFIPLDGHGLSNQAIGGARCAFRIRLTVARPSGWPSTSNSERLLQRMPGRRGTRGKSWKIPKCSKNWKVSSLITKQNYFLWWEVLESLWAQITFHLESTSTPQLPACRIFTFKDFPCRCLQIWSKAVSAKMGLLSPPQLSTSPDVFCRGFGGAGRSNITQKSSWNNIHNDRIHNQKTTPLGCIRFMLVTIEVEQRRYAFKTSDRKGGSKTLLISPKIWKSALKLMEATSVIVKTPSTYREGSEVIWSASLSSQAHH